MIKKINIFLVLLLLLISISAVSAADDANSTVLSSNDAVDIAASDGDSLLFSDVASEELLTSSVHIVNSSSYYDYFTSKGVLIDSSINEGDTLQIDGSFSGKEFIFRSPVNVVGTSTNNLKECIFTFYEGASGSTISNLKIANTNEYSYGVFLNGAQNCTIKGCIINNTGASSYPICVANNANYNNVSDNVLNTYGRTYGHGTRSTPALLLCNAHYNYIGNNHIACDDANGIYLSSFEGGPLKGGESTFNTIYNNTVKYNVLPTSWAYGIQIMGGNNIISYNTVIGGYRGISTSNSGNIIVNNWIINLTGADYNNPGEETGGEIAIIGSYNSTIRDNHIVNARIISTGSGISVLDNSVVENNYVEVLLQGKGVYPQGSNIEIKNNTIITSSGSGILYNTYSNNLKVLDNNITSSTGIGILIQKVSNKKMPGNLTIVGNTISTSNKYAIDAAEANSSSVNVIQSNTIKKGCEVRTPEGSYDPSKPAYTFNGTVYNINPSNYGDFINDNGGLSSDIKDGDILNFTGEFVNKNIIVINSAIKITGDNPVFYNTTFRVRCDGVWIENLKIRNNKADRVNAWGVVVYKVAGATITNCDIDVVDPNAAYAIYVVESSDVDVIGNTLLSSGDYLTYTLLAYSTEDCKFINNTIKTLGTGEVHIFENQHCLDGDTNCLDGDTNCLDGDTNCLDGDTNCLDGDTNVIAGSSIGNGNHVLSEVYRTYGIIMAYSSDNIVSGNIVNATSKLNKKVSQYNSTNSIVGIDSYFNCQNNVFSDNEVYIKANDNYIYGMGVLGYTTGHNAPEGQGAINNQFINNYIVIEGTYCVEGIIIGHESHDTIIENNIVNLKSDNVAYGITLEMSQKSTITDNYLTLNSDVIYGVEAFSSNNNTMNNNELELNGKQVYGILFSNSNYNSVISNIILANGTGEKLDFQNFDSIAAGNTGIFIKSNSTNNEIKKNTITSQKGYAIIVDDEAINNVITDNCLDSEKGIGNAAVNNTKNNIVENNYRYTFTGKMPAMRVNYLDTEAIKLTINDGAFVKFYIGDTEIGNATASNGVATLNYKFDNHSPGSYKINAVASKENYLTKEFSGILRINKGNLNVVLNDVSAKKLTNGVFIATLRDVSGSTVSDVNVKFYRVQGRYVYIGEATTDSNGVAKIIAEIPSISEGSYIISANVTDSKFNAASGQATLIILNDSEIKEDTFISAPDVSVVCGDASGKLVATVTSVYGDALVVDVDVNFNGEDYTLRTDSEGRISIPTSSLVPGSYVATISYKGNGTYNPSSATANVVVNKMDMIISAVYNAADEQIVVTLTSSATGKVIANTNVKVTLNGETTAAKTNSKGQAIISTAKLSPGTATISYAGNSKYNPASTTVVVTDKIKNNIIISAVYDASNNEIVATLTNAATGQAVANTNVKVNLNGEDYTAKTNSKGQAKVSAAGLPLGTYTATISYAGNSKYNPASTTIDIAVKTKVIVTDVYAYSDRIVAKLTNGATGKFIANANMIVEINGVKYNAKSDNKGQLTLNTTGLNLSDSYDLTISYRGNDRYTPSSAKVAVDLNKANMNIKYKYNATTKELTATLKNSKTGKTVANANMVVDINGVKTTLKSNKRGQIIFSTADYTPGTHVGTITYGGNARYNSISAAFKVDV